MPNREWIAVRMQNIQCRKENEMGNAAKVFLSEIKCRRTLRQKLRVCE